MADTAAGTSVNKNISTEDTAGQSAERVIGPATGPDAARVLVVLALVLTALSYVNTLRFQFVYDDLPQIISNPRVHSWQHAPRLFVEHVWSQFSGQPGELPATARTAGGSNPYAAVALAYMALRHYVLRGPRVSCSQAVARRGADPAVVPLVLSARAGVAGGIVSVPRHAPGAHAGLD